MRKLLSVLLLFSCFACPSVFAANPRAFLARRRNHRPRWSEHDRVVHARQRLTFGRGPGDIERVQAMGLDNGLSSSSLPRRLHQFRARWQTGPVPALCGCLPAKLAQAFPTNQMVREAAEGKRAMPSDPTQYGLWEVLVGYVTRSNRKITLQPSRAVAPPVDPQTKKPPSKQSKDTARHIAEMLLALPKANRMSTLMRLPIRRTAAPWRSTRRKTCATSWSWIFLSPAEREAYFAMNNPNAVVVAELQMAKVQRVAYQRAPA